MVESTSNLTPTQRYAASALFAIVLNQAQINQTQPLGVPAAEDDDGGDEERRSNAVAEILSPMTPAFGYTRRLAFFDPFSDVLRLIHRLGSVSSKQLALLQLSTTSVRYG